jgi:probable phosphoglycerate mutase
MPAPLPTLYLARHATPDWSRTDLTYHLPPGPPLTPQGEAEARQLGEFFRDMGVRRILASPLERCLRTAELAAEVCGAAVARDDRLAEWRPGEQAPQVLARVWPAWVHAGESALAGQPAALVTHGGPIGALLAELGVPAQEISRYQRQFDRNNPVPPAGAWRALRSAPDSPWSLDLAFQPQAHPARAWYL